MMESGQSKSRNHSVFQELVSLTNMGHKKSFSCSLTNEIKFKLPGNIYHAVQMILFEVLIYNIHSLNFRLFRDYYPCSWHLVSVRIFVRTLEYVKVFFSLFFAIYYFSHRYKYAHSYNIIISHDLRKELIISDAPIKKKTKYMHW